MRIARICAAGAFLAVLVGCQAFRGNGWPLEKSNPFAKRVKQNTISGERHNAGSAEPSPVERPSHRTNKSWLNSLFRHEEPKRVESLKDWVGLPRPG